MFRAIFAAAQGLTGALQRPSQEGLAMQRKLVSKKELKTVYGIPYSFAHIARLEAAGLFPKRVRLGACRVAWFADEIEVWIASRPRASAA
jgi:prophage regulatory protein